MKKILFLSILSGLVLTGCTNDDLLGGDNVKGGNKDAIGFQFQQKNMTRGELQKLQNSHYEFGVFADNGGTVMDNYLVAYAESDLYKSLYSGATTYGDPSSQVDGLSYWFYESLGKTAGTYVHTAYNTPDNDQDLKYWDKSKEMYKFWAYAPYTNSAAASAVNNPVRMLLTNASTIQQLTFFNLSTFYTNPVATHQIVSADTRAAIASGADYNAEMINYNEALYDYTEYTNSQYGTDVPFDFKHINAKINLKFYNDIKGYDLEIIDAVPEGTLPGTGVAPTAAKGIQLSPATTLQSWTRANEAQPKKLPTYFEKTRVDVSAIPAATGQTAGTITVGTGATKATVVNKNLVFNKIEGNIGTTKASATPSNTTLYVLPNVKANVTAPTVAEYITPEAFEGEEWMEEIHSGKYTKWNTDDKKSTHVADSTGYTLHVSYVMHPKDGSADITMYDARVFIPASACQWVAGKAYTYIFKITKNSNGTTNPKEVDPATPAEPWVDVTDPRVREEAGLQPIVFDGIQVYDYDDVDAGEYIISETSLDWSLENAFNNLKTILSTGNTAAEGKTVAQTIYTTGTTLEGKDGTAADKAYVFTLNTVTSDYINYTGDVNNNNVFKDLQAIFQALYNEKGIKEVVYGSTTYTRSGNGETTPYSFYYDGKSIESVIATEMYDAAWIYGTGNKTSGAVKLISSNTANPDAPIFFQVKVDNTADEVFSETALKRAVVNYVPVTGSNVKVSIKENSDKNYTLTLNVVDADLMWPGFPQLTAAQNPNDNNVYKNVLHFFDGLAPEVFASVKYNGTACGENDEEGIAYVIGQEGFQLVCPGFTSDPQDPTIVSGAKTLPYPLVMNDGTNDITVYLAINVK